MVFNSLIFIVFFLIVVGIHYSPISWTTKKVSLLLASYIFYAAWNPPFIILLWISTVVDYFMARLLDRENRPLQRKMLLLVSLVLNLGMLAYFKYGNFFLENFITLVSSFGIAYQPAALDIILPVGISFYTFQTLSYTIDVYRKDLPAEKSLLDFSLFVTFFPQLVAGPIVRPADLIPQFKKPHYATTNQFAWGSALIILGLFMKVVIADNLLGPSADLVFGLPMPLNMLDSWTGVLAFSGQIFCDFAGYSTVAIGVSHCLGFTLLENFRYPYAAVGFSDFWKRWHISLSTWLRDYLYIPLGGNKLGSVRTYMNLAITMLLGGLWHGASWTFVVWGALHGFYLIVERLFKRVPTPNNVALAAEPVLVQSSFVPSITATTKKQKAFGLALLTFFFINITWVFFRSPDFGTAGRILGSMFGVIPNGATMVSTIDILKVFSVMFAMVVMHWRMRDKNLLTVIKSTPTWLVVTIWTMMLCSLMLAQYTGDAFIYFQF